MGYVKIQTDHHTGAILILLKRHLHFWKCLFFLALQDVMHGCRCSVGELCAGVRWTRVSVGVSGACREYIGSLVLGSDSVAPPPAQYTTIFGQQG